MIYAILGVGLAGSLYGNYYFYQKLKLASQALLAAATLQAAGATVAHVSV